MKKSYRCEKQIFGVFWMLLSFTKILSIKVKTYADDLLLNIM